MFGSQGAARVGLRLLLTGWLVMCATAVSLGKARKETPEPGPLDPQGGTHIPIGIANTLDTLKTFVEAEGCFSPGVGSCGIYFWLWNPRTKELSAATMPNVPCRHGLAEGGLLIPWSSWSAGTLNVRTEVCHVVMRAPKGPGHVAAARVHLTNTGKGDRAVQLYAALRGLGPAGWPVERLAVSKGGDALLVDGRPALVSTARVAAAGVAGTDTIGELATAGKMPDGKIASSKTGDCSGALRLDATVPAGETETFGFVCPVLPGRRAVGHDWDGRSGWAQVDLARPNPPTGGVLQPDPGLDYYRALKVDALFEQAAAYWKDLVGRVSIELPDRRWAEALAAITAHAAITMNEGAPDVAVVNYNVFNRDGVYMANILQKAGRGDLSEAAIDYLLSHPFNGRTRVEADNPGQVLWAMGQHWLYSRDAEWLARVYPSAAKIAAMIEYCRTTPRPHYVKATSLEFGEKLPPDGPDDRPAHRKQVLRPGSCDGKHPEYTEAFDVAGLRAAAMLAEALGRREDAKKWGRLAEKLFAGYDERFGERLPKGYGSYCVLWPCRLYPLNEGKAYEQFTRTGPQRPGGWRYFPLARAHQGLLAGSRSAGWGTLASHLDHPQMRGWYAFDEGGRSGSGGWGHLRTTWKSSVAMPHGWAVAELHLLLRDCLLFEDGGRVVLLAGVPPEWFTAAGGMAFDNMPTHFGSLSLRYKPTTGGAELALTGPAEPPGGFELRMPAPGGLKVMAAGKTLAGSPNGGYVLPSGTRRARIAFSAPKE